MKSFSLILFAALLAMSFICHPTTPTLFMIGDSTMANKTSPEDHPAERGWGMLLPEFFNPKIKIENHAMNGRSSKSFRAEGRWQAVLNRLHHGDFVFIQFAHNDEKLDSALHTDPQTTYRANLIRYVNETRAKGAVPILFTSIVRRTLLPDGKLRDTHGKYINVVLDVARELNVVSIDLHSATRRLVESLGEEQSKSLYMWISDTDTKGCKDNTHLNAAGARAVAGIAVDSIRVKVPVLIPFLRK